MNKEIKKIIVLGGGTAGLVSALMLKQKFPKIKVELIRSSEIGTVGVGEGSTEHWSDFTKFVEISHHDVVKHCDATFKSGIMFKNWGSPDYLQSVGSVFNYRNKKIPFIYLHLLANGATPKDMVSLHAWESKVNTWFIDNNESGPSAQFHFNTHKLNDFLTKTAVKKEIVIIDDEIIDVTIDQQGIKGLVGKAHSTHDADFYVDASGFRKELIGKLGGKWNSHRRYLKMNSSIVFPTEQGDDIPMYTTATALDAGWMFNIPVYGRNGNGYIFDSDHITADQAKQEVEKRLGHGIDVGKEIKFDPGALEKSWIKNCCAVGLSSSFVEPLEASSIGTTIQQMFLLLDLIANYDDAVINKYNKILKGIIDNIRDFIVLHYITGREDTEFWRSLSDIDLPDSLSEKMEIWRHHIPTIDDFINVSNYRLFNDFHHTLVLHGLGLFDLNSIRKEYENLLSEDIKKEAERLIADERNLKCITVSHKMMLDIIRTMKKENYEER